jgi:hypothetical protein
VKMVDEPSRISISSIFKLLLFLFFELLLDYICRYPTDRVPLRTGFELTKSGECVCALSCALQL